MGLLEERDCELARIEESLDRVTRVALAVTAALLLLAGAAGQALAASPVSEFQAGGDPNVIAKGPDGAMWFSEWGGDRIGRVAPNGAVTQYPNSGALTAGANPSGIVAGPDGNIWFTEFAVGKIGEINPSTGALVGEYPLPAGRGSEPEGITVGPDGALWFTERGANNVGRLNPAAVSPGTSNGISEYSVAQLGTHLSYQPVDLVAGPDGALWVTLFGVDGVARVDTSGTVTRYALPTAGSEPEGIAVGPDGKLWVAEYGVNKVARVDPALVSPGTSNGITEFAVGGKPLWVSAAGDGAMWFTDNTDSELLRFDTSSDTSTVFGAGQGVTGDATSDAQDANGNLWFTEFHSSKVGEVSFSHPPVNTAPPAIYATVRGLPTRATTAVVGEVLTCHAGTWNNSPTTHTYYWEWTEQYYVPGNKRRPDKVQSIGSGISAGGPTGSGQTLRLPDLPAFKAHPARLRISISSIACIDDATDAVGETASARSAPVPIYPVVPLLATRKVSRGRHGIVTVPIEPPSITKNVGAGGTNSCTSGLWLHYPTLYTYRWYRLAPVKLVHTGKSYKVTMDDEGHRLVCEATASNDAGHSKRADSNTYTVPASSPHATRAPVMTMSTLNPTTASVTIGGTAPNTVQGYLYNAIAERIFLSCDNGSWNRNDLTFRTRWYVDGYGGNDRERQGDNGFAVVGDQLAYQHTFNTDSLRFNFLPSSSQDPSIFFGRVTCIVTATTPQGREADSSSDAAQIWNGCSIGFEAWDKKVLLNGPLCKDYESGYAPPGCDFIKDPSACFNFSRDLAAQRRRLRL